MANKIQETNVYRTVWSWRIDPYGLTSPRFAEQLTVDRAEQATQHPF